MCHIIASLSIERTGNVVVDNTLTTCDACHTTACIPLKPAQYLQICKHAAHNNKWLPDVCYQVVTGHAAPGASKTATCCPLCNETALMQRKSACSELRYRHNVCSIIRSRLYEICQVGTTLLWAGIPAAVYLQSLNPCDIWNLVPRKLLEGTL